MATVESQTVTLTINGREITVPKGRTLVEAASEAGIEIPVFCYEPRLGAGVGACRMCLCEIEGMPKLQTACTTPAGDGMVVNSHSGRAREGQDAVLEFLLLNHPLDCPVCDKGGECPLQDLTFRYGPGVTRMTLPKRTHDKPVPVSPLIKLDRERCILCYRCTRFSESVSGDMQLVTENRGAHSMITTFEGRPYTNEFSGNVTELCPVGALTSSTYRFRARPWEIQNVPTVCTGCAVGCNISASIREGHVVRLLSRNHPEVDEGWLCDRGRYALGHLRAPDRVVSAMIRGGRGLEAVPAADALEHVSERLRTTAAKFGAGSIAVLASATQTNEEAHLWARILAEGMSGGISVCGPDGHSGLDTLSPYLASIADLDTASAIVVAGDTELSQRAPVIELRIRKAVTAGARVITVGVGGTRLETLRGAQHISTGAGTAHATVLSATNPASELGELLATADSTVVIWNGRVSQAAADVLAHVAHTLGAKVLITPAANELGIHAAGLGTHTPTQALEAAESGEIKAIVLLGSDPVGDWTNGERWRGALARSQFVLQITAFQNDSSGWATTVVPGSETLEQEGTVTNLEGRVQRLRAAATPPEGVLDGYAWTAELGERLGLEVPLDAPQAFAELAASRPAFAGMSWSSLGERAELPERPQAGSAPPEPRVAAARPKRGTTLIAYRELMSGAGPDHSPELHFQKRIGIEINHDDAEKLRVATGDRITVSFDGRSASGPAIASRRLRPGTVRMAQRVPYVGPATVVAAPLEEGANA
jgi:NADH-quinone oxidoreductase subunit G